MTTRLHRLSASSFSYTLCSFAALSTLTNSPKTTPVPPKMSSELEHDQCWFYVTSRHTLIKADTQNHDGTNHRIEFKLTIRMSDPPYLRLTDQPDLNPQSPSLPRRRYISHRILFHPESRPASHRANGRDLGRCLDIALRRRRRG